MLDIAIDLSGRDGVFDFAQAKQSGIVAVCHRATEGTGRIDPAYVSNRVTALAAGLLWGAYHVGMLGDGIAQAEAFFQKTFHSNAAEAQDMLLALEFSDRGPATMTLDQAKDFAQHVYSKLGRYPCIFSGPLIKQLLGNKPPDPMLSQCPLWIVQHGDRLTAPTDIPPTWQLWNLWQYATGEGKARPHPVPGIRNCGRDRFNGDDPQVFNFFWTGGPT